MRYLLSILGMVAALYLVKYRERIGDMIGEAEWMTKVGGVYNVIIVVALLVFFWSIAVLTGTQDVFLKPIILLLPGVNNQGGQPQSDFYID